MVSDSPIHISVMLREVLARLCAQPEDCIVDFTTGIGGHSERLMESARSAARLICLDRDPEILKIARERLARFEGRVHFEACVSDGFGRVLKKLGDPAINVAFMDLGVSSLQLDRPERGFSFRAEGPLDMRMGSSGRTALDVLKESSEEELEAILREYGEEPSARRIAKRLVELRKGRLPRTTIELARFIESLQPARPKGRSAVHPATRVFQALRIAVNDELGVLQRTLDELMVRMAPGGRLGVLSFHSLEDGIVKRHFKESARAGLGEVVTRRPDRPQEGEVRENPRARSARFRVFLRGELGGRQS